RWQKELSEGTLDHIRGIMTQGLHHRGNTENHWLMYYVGHLLAAEMWPNEPTLWNGLCPSVVRDEAMRWLGGMIDRTARTGHHEYDSPQYHGWHVTPMIALADHAQDDGLREQAKKMATLLIADMALEYFEGAWAGGHAREGYRENTWHYAGTSAALMPYYFGDEREDAMHIQPGMCPAVTAHYQPPVLFANIARERSVPRIIKKTKAPRTIYRHVEGETKPVRKYTYLSQSFALGSTQLGLPNGSGAPIDLVSWDLTWCAPKHEGIVTCNHPYLSPKRFSAFLSEAPQSVGRSVAAPKPALQNPDRLSGASPFEQMMQCENAMIILYRIPEDDTAPYVNLYLPQSVRWVEKNGWIVGDMNDFYLGLRPIGAYRWESIKEDNHVDGWLLRIEDVNAGLVVEAVEANSVASFDAFCEAITQCDLDLHDWQDQGVVRYDAWNGRRLEMAYDGDHLVDGEGIDYDAWPLYGGPGIEAPLGKGVVRFEQGDDTVVLDFEVDENKEMIPMRVIG
ncbi:MAG: hypothetical protein HN521_22060, partial [Candidatus Latescibacteria bacterium]|nr:hypothetical protein [Candidatus Latescibacterota bacterium]